MSFIFSMNLSLGLQSLLFFFLGKVYFLLLSRDFQYCHRISSNYLRVLRFFVRLFACFCKNWIEFKCKYKTVFNINKLDYKAEIWQTLDAWPFLKNVFCISFLHLPKLSHFLKTTKNNISEMWSSQGITLLRASKG